MPLCLRSLLSPGISLALAGWALAPVAVWAAPRLDAWWAARQAAHGYAPARGAEAYERPAALTA